VLVSEAPYIRCHRKLVRDNPKTVEESSTWYLNEFVCNVGYALVTGNLTCSAGGIVSHHVHRKRKIIFNWDPFSIAMSNY